jgi:hypothetical protein
VSRKPVPGRSRGNRTYKTWAKMLERCRNSRANDFQRYGGRGITVCERWLKFENFFADMGEKPLGLTIERKNNDGNYEPGNCRWATDAEQRSNTRRTRLITYNGKTQTATMWAHEVGIPLGRLWNRTKKNWPPELILNPARYVYPGMLTPEQVEEIALLKGKASQAAIATLFGVSRHLVYRIHNRRERYSNVPG